MLTLCFCILFQTATLEPLITGLQEALPKSIGLLPFDGGVTGTWLLIFFICYFLSITCKQQAADAYIGLDFLTIY